MENNNFFFAEERVLPDPGYEFFKEEFEKMTGIRLNLYKEKQMKRRINSLIERKKCSGYEEFLTLLKSSPEELAFFNDYITINVTEFFRTPEQWEYFDNNILAGLVKKKDCLKIWSCACATGEEPYSLAMSLVKRTDPSHFHILATDIDDKAIERAAEGRYDQKSMEKLPEEIIERFFKKESSAGYQISEKIRTLVEYRKLDLLKDPYPTECDLIVCRNVLIYFTEEAKNHIYGLFKKSLRRGGYLFTGNTEQIIYYKKYGLKKINNYLYQNV